MTYSVNTVADMQNITGAVDGDICYVVENTSYYRYSNSVWVFWYKERTSLAFQGITLEQTDDDQMAFQGITLEMEPFAFDPLMLGLI